MKCETSDVAGNLEDIAYLLYCSNMTSFEKSTFSNVLSSSSLMIEVSCVFSFFSGYATTTRCEFHNNPKA